MLVNRKFDALVVVIVMSLIGYTTLQPQYRLRADPPPEFMREAHSTPPETRGTEERIARAYWKCAVSDIQWRYGYAHRLPLSPPAEFTISNQEFGRAASDSDIRTRYWSKLQEVWYMRTVWSKEYGWNFRSLTETLEAASRWFEEQVTRFSHS